MYSVHYVPSNIEHSRFIPRSQLVLEKRNGFGNSVHSVTFVAIGEEAAAQEVDGTIVWAFRMFKKPRSRYTSARG